MNDEACTTFEATVDQMSEGHAFLWRTFGVLPKIGWQIGMLCFPLPVSVRCRCALLSVRLGVSVGLPHSANSALIHQIRSDTARPTRVSLRNLVSMASSLAASTMRTTRSEAAPLYRNLYVA